MRERVLRDQVRIDGRGLTDIRTLTAEVGVVPRVHGSALFERGETQILGITTLNMLSLEQKLDTLSPETSRRYMHNYNFPPYSTGETGRVGSPKRREIGHGALAGRALHAGAADARGVPVRDPPGLRGARAPTAPPRWARSARPRWACSTPVSRCARRSPASRWASSPARSTARQKYVTLTDILGAEDAFGDMDFKVAGTREFVTALQLDTKLDGIPAEVLGAALSQARDARMTILDVMAEAIDASGRDGPDRAADPHDEGPGRQDR